jgi:hypothetical protein
LLERIQIVNDEFMIEMLYERLNINYNFIRRILQEYFRMFIRVYRLLYQLNT